MSSTSLTSYTLPQLVALQSTYFAAQSNTEVLDGENEPLGDIWGAVALAALAVLNNLLYVNNKSRLLTSGNASGSNTNAEYSPDVDSFVNVFGIYRDPSTAATGTVAFQISSASTQDNYIQVGTTVTTSTGLTFVVVADSTKGSYTANGYLVPAGSTTPVSVTVQCNTLGTTGNISASAITSLTSGVGTVASPVNYTVTNSQAFTNGSNGETDAALAARFQAEFISGRFATRLAVLTAIAGTQANLTYQIIESYNLTVPTLAWFTIYVNIIGSDSTTPSSVLTAVSNAVANTKALGISYTVAAPTLEVVPVTATIIPDPNWLLIPGNTTALLTANVQAAYDNYVNNIGLSPTNSSTLLSAAKVSAVLVSVPGVSNVSGYTLNGGTTDLTAAAGTQFVAGAATLTVT